MIYVLYPNSLYVRCLVDPFLAYRCSLKRDVLSFLCKYKAYGDRCIKRKVRMHVMPGIVEMRCKCREMQASKIAKRQGGVGIKRKSRRRLHLFVAELKEKKVVKREGVQGMKAKVWITRVTKFAATRSESNQISEVKVIKNVVKNLLWKRRKNDV